MSPSWHFTSLKQCNILFVPKFHTNSLEKVQLPKNLKLHLPHVNKWIRHQHKLALVQSPKGASHTKSHCPLSTRSCLFQSGYSQLNHHKRDSQIVRSKIAYSLIEPLNYLIVHQSAATNSMQLQSTHPSNLQHH